MPALTAQRSVRPRPTARGLLGFLAELDARHRARMQLAELDDRILRDIGLTRADVADELRGGVRW